MAKQTFTTGDVLTAAAMSSLQQTAMLGGAASAKTANYTLTAADAGTLITMSNAGATTITVNTGLFAAGDTVTIMNIGVGTCTITAGTATVSKPTNATLALVTNASGVLYFTATSAAIFMPFDVGSGATTPAFVGCSVYLSASQAIANSTNQAITFDSEEYDTNAFHSTVTNTSRLTIPASYGGYYRISCLVGFASNATGVRNAKIYKNGTSIFNFSQPITATGNPQSAGGTATVNLAVGDYIELIALQTSGGNLDAVNASGGRTTFIEIQYLGA